MRLSKENIQFIDNYLKNSGVSYFDIRMEMLDHVATAVEQKMTVENLDFYDAFKSYMVVNKKELMEENEKTNHYNFSVIIPFLKFCCKPTFLILFVLLEIGFYQLSKIYDIDKLCLIVVWSLFLTMALSFLSFVTFYYFNNKNRFYYVEKSSSILFFIYQPMFLINNVFLIGKNRNPSIWVGFILVFFATLFITYLFYYLSEMKRFKAKNKYLLQ